MSKILGNSEELNSVVNVGKYGAVGNGTTDDTTAIQAALSSTAKIIEFTSGKTYLVNGALTSAVEGRTIIATGATIKLKNAATNTKILTITGAYTTVQGGTWDGNRDNQLSGTAYNSYPIIFSSTSNGLVQEIVSTNWRGSGMYAANSSYIVVDKCKFNNIGNGNETCYGVYMEATTADHFGCKVTNSNFYMSDSGTAGQPVLFTSLSVNPGGVSMRDWEISGNYVEGSTDVTQESAAICLAVRGDRGRVVNNYTTGGSMSWSEGGDNTIFVGNTFKDTAGKTRWGIEFSGSNVVISNNVITNHSRCINPTAKNGINNNDDCVITGNYLEIDNTYTSPTLGSARAIVISPDTAQTARRVAITGNVIKGRICISAARAVSDWDIVGNELIGPGSATAGTRGIFTDNVETPLRWNISSNKFNGFERAMGVYNITGVAVSDIQFNNNNCVNDVGGGASFLIAAEGTATLGARVSTMMNALNSTNLAWYYDRSANVSISLSNSVANPESNISASIGAQYYNTAGSGGTTLWLKESGANTTTGWTRIGSTQQFANGTAAVPSIQSKAYPTTGIYFSTTDTVAVSIASDPKVVFGPTFPAFNYDNLRISYQKTPSSATDTGVTGTICWDTNYLYVCVATDTWTRIPLGWV